MATLPEFQKPVQPNPHSRWLLAFPTPPILLPFEIFETDEDEEITLDDLFPMPSDEPIGGEF